MGHGSCHRARAVDAQVILGKWLRKRSFTQRVSVGHRQAMRGPSLKSTGALSHGELKMESDLSRQRARRHIVRPAEGRKEVIQRQFVGHVDSGERKTPFVTFAF